jgi:hypothetical protein
MDEERRNLAEPTGVEGHVRCNVSDVLKHIGLDTCHTITAVF